MLSKKISKSGFSSNDLVISAKFISTLILKQELNNNRVFYLDFTRDFAAVGSERGVGARTAGSPPAAPAFFFLPHSRARGLLPQLRRGG